MGRLVKPCQGIHKAVQWSLHFPTRESSMRCNFCWWCLRAPGVAANHELQIYLQDIKAASWREGRERKRESVFVYFGCQQNHCITTSLLKELCCLQRMSVLYIKGHVRWRAVRRVKSSCTNLHRKIKMFHQFHHMLINSSEQNWNKVIFQIIYHYTSDKTWIQGLHLTQAIFVFFSSGRCSHTLAAHKESIHLNDL